MGENIVYDSVIKQFDDLMFELSDSKQLRKKYSKNKLESSLEKSLISSDIENPMLPTQLYDLKCKASSHTTNIINSKMASKDIGKAVKLPIDDLIKNPMSDTQEAFPWINSNLWDLESKKQTSQIQKLDLMRDSAADDLSQSNLESSKEQKIKLSERTFKSPRHNYVFNPTFDSCFKPSQRKDMNVLSHQSSSRYDPISYSNSCFKERSPVYNPIAVSHGMPCGKYNILNIFD